MAAAISEKNTNIDMVKHEEHVMPTHGGAGVDVDQNNMPLGQSIRRYPKIAGYAFFVTLAILLWGYGLVIVGTVSSIPAFQ